MTLDAGTTGTMAYDVGEADLASTLPLQEGDGFPAVLATARVVALMEIAAARVLQPLLEAGQLSVGVSIELQHTNPTPLGARVEVRATYDGPADKLHRFTIEASDPGGPIATATHVRAIVDRARLEDRARKRA